MTDAHKEDVSIILVTYNREQFLPRTIDSILSQTYPHFELLICDDHSTDGTPRICEEYARRDPRIRYIRNPKNLSMPDNLNNGIRLARHELVADLHDGDFFAPTLIEKWRDALLRYPRAGFVSNRYVHLSPDGVTGATTGPLPELSSGKDFLERVIFRDREVECPVWGTVMARRSVYERMGLFEERLSFWADIDMWFRIAEEYDVAHVPEPLIFLPHRATMPHLFSEKNLRAHWMMFRIHWAARSRHYPDRPWKRLAAHASMLFWFVTVRARKLRRRFGRAKPAGPSAPGEAKPGSAA